MKLDTQFFKGLFDPRTDVAAQWEATRSERERFIREHADELRLAYSLPPLTDCLPQRRKKEQSWS